MSAGGPGGERGVKSPQWAQWGPVGCGVDVPRCLWGCAGVPRPRGTRCPGVGVSAAGSRPRGWGWSGEGGLLGPAFPRPRCLGELGCSTLNSAWDEALKATAWRLPPQLAAARLPACPTPLGSGTAPGGPVGGVPPGLWEKPPGLLWACFGAILVMQLHAPRSDGSPPHWLQALKLKKKKS